MIKEDLHLHSTYSDGTRSPEEIVRRAKELGLEKIAISDHDSNSGIPEALEAGEKYGIKVIPSIELGCRMIVNGKSYGDAEFLGIGTDYQKMFELTLPIRQSRRRKVEAFIGTINRIYRENLVDEFNGSLNNFSNEYETAPLYKLRKDAPTIDLRLVLEYKFHRQLNSEETERLAQQTTLTAFDVISFVLDNLMQNPEDLAKIHKKRIGYVLKDALIPWLPKGLKEYTLSSEEAIKGIISCGGTPVLAHPARNFKFLERVWAGETGTGKLNPEKWVRELMSYGLKGLELYYYSGNGFSMEEEMAANRYFASLAQKYGLLTTIGSDCHGPKEDLEEFIGKFDPDYL